MHTTSGPALSWIGLSRIPGVGRTTFRKLVTLFGSPEQVLEASRDDLRTIGGLSDKVADAFGSYPWREFAEQEIARADRDKVAIIIANDPAYPENLRNTPDPPLYLYVRGSLLPEDDGAVAIVGTRKPTRYGTIEAHRIASALSAAGCTIVSGMARGIDTLAHQGALSSSGRTIAVLGCGIDVVYPPENQTLRNRITENGAVITENPFGTPPEAGYFPARNRIISGLSRGTIIIEAAEDSGSLITAQYALEQGRKLYAVPGYVGSPLSRGTNNLIRRGAFLVQAAEDVLKDLGAQSTGSRPESAARPLPALSEDEDAVFRCITDEPKHIDSIMSESRTAAGKLGGLLVSLELKGLAKQLPGKYFVRDA